LRESQVAGDGEKTWSLWQQHLAERKRPRDLVARWSGEPLPLLWGVVDNLPPGAEPEPSFCERVARLVERDSQSSRRWRELARDAESFAAELDVTTGNPEQARDVLALATIMPRLAKYWSAVQWLAVFDRLVAMVSGEAATSASRPPLVWQLFAAELPLVLAYQFPEVASCQQLTDPAIEVLVRGMGDLIDEDGLPTWFPLVELPQMVACWTRCRMLIDNVGDESEWVNVRFGDVFQNLLRLSHLGKQGMLLGPGSCSGLEGLIAATGRHSDDRKLRRLAEAMIAPGHDEVDKFGDKISPAVHAESAKLAVLRTDWRASSPRMAVQYQGCEFAMELAVGRETILAGVVESNINFNGIRLLPTADWEECVWVSDDDVDYLELEMPLTEDVRIQRHVLLARKDKFLFMADAVLGSRDRAQPGAIDGRLTLPLAEGIEFKAEERTREGTLVGHKPRARILPLALPEWRSDRRVGALEQSGQSLTLTQGARNAAGMFLPLFIDLDPKRHRRACTWRQLTVGEDRQIVPPDMASGYRVQVGEEQWLFYRSLHNRNSRTLLGHHLLHEFLAGRFTPKGKVVQLLAIESELGSPE